MEKKENKKDVSKDISDYFKEVYSSPFYPKEDFTKKQEKIISEVTSNEKTEKRAKVTAFFKRNSGSFKSIRKDIDKIFEDNISRCRVFLMCITIAETEIFTSNSKGLIEKYKEWVCLFHKNKIPEVLQSLLTLYVNDDFCASKHYDKIEKIMNVWGWNLNRFINFTLESSWIMQERMYDVPLDFDSGSSEEEEEFINLDSGD